MHKQITIFVYMVNSRARATEALAREQAKFIAFARGTSGETLKME